MATESNIFEQYCCKAILELTDKGIIRGDYDWDRFVRGRGITYTIRSVDEATGRPLAYFVIKRKGKTIIVFDELSKKQKEYDFDPETRNIDEFAEFLILFANDIRDMDDKYLGDQPKVMDMSKITLDQDHLDKQIDEEELKDLVESIKEFGFLSPILVQEKEGQYVIIAGERRWRAAQIAGLTEIPVIVRK